MKELSLFSCNSDIFLLLALLISVSFATYYYFESRRSKDNLRLTLQASSDIVFLIDKNCCYLEVYASKNNMLFETREKLIGQPIGVFLGPDLGTKAHACVENAFLTGQRQIFIYEAMLDGQLHYFEASMERRDSHAVVAMIRDVTETKTLQIQIETERAKQFESARLASLGEMAGGIAHEVNTPLAIILASSELLQLAAQREPVAIDKIIKQVERIILTTNRISIIIKGLRSLARDGSNDNLEKFPVEIIVHNTLSLCADQFRNKGVDIQIDLEDDLHINCRSVQISQVLLNLLNNAFYAVTKQKQQEPFIIVSSKKTIDGHIEIAVVDSGQGIPKELRTKIFEPFFTTKVAGEGTGLGLSISKNIVANNGGDLSLDITSERTRFCMRFPITELHKLHH